MAFKTYIEQIHQLLDRIGTEQAAAIGMAGAMVAETLKKSGIIHTFGTGHSHMIAEEAFFRAGGLVPVNAILDGRGKRSRLRALADRAGADHGGRYGDRHFEFRP
jgi:uncharacterized phosphosugar-binding protein